MRTKEVIVSLLKNALSGPVWDSLKKAVIGQELINYGAAITSLNDVTYRSYHNNLYPDTASMRGLLQIAYTNDLSFSHYKPYSVKINPSAINNKGDFNTLVYDSFHIMYKVGNACFFNIKPVHANGDIDLYQGVLHVHNWWTAIEDFKDFVTASGYVTEGELTAYLKENRLGDLTESYIKLGEYVIPDSVKIAYRPGGISGKTYYYSLRTPLNAKSDVYNFILKRVWDRQLCAFFGNGVNGMEMPTLINPYFALIWLVPSFNEVVTVAEDSSSWSGNVSFKFYQREVVQVPMSDIFVSATRGNAYSLPHGRYSLKSSMAKSTIIASKDNIQSFCKTVPGVLDVNIVNSDVINTVLIYVKPESQTGSGDFTFLNTELNLYGEMVTRYVALPGNPANFIVGLTSSTSLTEAEKDEVIDRIQSITSYSKLPYKADVASIVVSGLYGLEGVGLIVDVIQTMKMSDTVDLYLIPSQNTIKVYKMNGTEVDYSSQIGWDYAGYLYVYSGLTTNFGISTDCFVLGDFFFVPGESISSNAVACSMDMNYGVSYDNSSFDVAAGSFLSPVPGVSTKVDRVLRRCYSTTSFSDEMLARGAYFYLRFNEASDYYELVSYVIGRPFVEGNYSLLYNPNHIIRTYERRILTFQEAVDLLGVPNEPDAPYRYYDANGNLNCDYQRVKLSNYVFGIGLFTFAPDTNSSVESPLLKIAVWNLTSFSSYGYMTLNSIKYEDLVATCAVGNKSVLMFTYSDLNKGVAWSINLSGNFVGGIVTIDASLIDAILHNYKGYNEIYAIDDGVVVLKNDLTGGNYNYQIYDFGSFNVNSYNVLTSTRAAHLVASINNVSDDNPPRFSITGFKGNRFIIWYDPSGVTSVRKLYDYSDYTLNAVTLLNDSGEIDYDTGKIVFPIVTTDENTYAFRYTPKKSSINLKNDYYPVVTDISFI